MPAQVMSARSSSLSSLCCAGVVDGGDDVMKNRNEFTHMCMHLLLEIVGHTSGDSLRICLLDDGVVAALFTALLGG